MFTKLKLYIVLGVIVVGLGIFVSRYLNNHSFVSDKFIAEKDTTISKKDKEILVLKKQVFSIQQDLDICNANDSKLKIVIAGQNKQIKALEGKENTCCEELKHAEETGGIIRYNWLGKVKKKK